MRVAMHQPHYLPWLGYVDKLDRADLFILVDHVQFEWKGWQSRNYVKTAQGPTLLSIPLLQASRLEPVVDKVVDDRRPWRKKHRKTIELSYRGAPYWNTYGPDLLALYDAPHTRLVDFAIASTRILTDTFGVTTPCVRSSELGDIPGAKTELIAALCETIGAATFISGEGARDYLDVELLGQRGIAVEWQDFRHPIYPQLYPHAGFVPRLAALDLLLNVGADGLRVVRDNRGSSPSGPQRLAVEREGGPR